MITLASDFGSAYPAAMKGVILSRCDARLIDVAHDLPRQDVRAAAFWLRETLPYFPPAVHLVVVDPGVGTERRALVLRVGDHVLVGPDNGVLRPPARRIAAEYDDEPPLEAYEIRVEQPASHTFHGRDVFAPAAADAHEVGVDALDSIERFVPIERTTLADCVFPNPEHDERGVTGEVLVVDDFGNCITNIPGDEIEGRGRVAVNGEPTPVGQTFEAVLRGSRLVTVGSHGYVECDVNHGRGDDAFGLAPGDEVRLDFD